MAEAKEFKGEEVKGELLTVESTFDRVTALFSFRALIIVLVLGCAFWFYYTGEMEAAAFFGGLFSTWAGHWLFNKNEKE
jgi:hypothetical protein